MMDTRGGGCLCGQVRYTVPATPLAVSVCHCRDCQKQAGSAFSIIAVFPRDAFETEGAIAIYECRGTSGEPVLRHFCGQCGSPLYSDNRAMAERGIVAVKAGTLDEVADLVPVRHFWVDSRQSWVTIADDIPCLATQ